MTTGDIEPYSLCKCHTTIVQIDYTFGSVPLFLHHTDCHLSWVNGKMFVSSNQATTTTTTEQRKKSFDYNEVEKRDINILNLCSYKYTHRHTHLYHPSHFFRVFQTTPQNAYGCKVYFYCMYFNTWSYFNCTQTHPCQSTCVYTFLYRVYKHILSRQIHVCNMDTRFLWAVASTNRISSP